MILYDFKFNLNFLFISKAMLCECLDNSFYFLGLKRFYKNIFFIPGLHKIWNNKTLKMLNSAILLDF